MADEKASGLSAAHAPVIILSILFIVAVILGFATGSLNDSTLKQVMASPSDPITIP
jgi:hypothetical protein